MDKGIFSASLVSLQLQVQGLFEGAGGSRAMQLLDGLSQLSVEEQTRALECFERVVHRILSGDRRYLSSEEIAEGKMVDAMCEEILAELARRPGYRDHHAPMRTRITPRLEVVRGGKLERRSSTPIDIGKARAAKKPTKGPATL